MSSLIVSQIAFTAPTIPSDTLVVNVGSDGKAPFLKSSPVQSLYAILTPILGQLIYSSNSYDLEPGLIQSFRWDHKRQIYILKLKNNLTFHNGRKVTAKDLEFSILRGFFTNKANWFEAFFGNIEGIEALKGQTKFKSGMVSGIKLIDDTTLHIKLIKPNPSFLHSLARTYYSLVPIEELESDYETWKQYPVGAGPYKVAEYDATETLKLQKLYGEGPSKVLFRFSSGTQDSDVDIHFKEGNGKSLVMSDKSTSVTGIYFNYQSSVASQEVFRRAIDLAVDRDALVSGIDVYRQTAQFLASHFWGRISTQQNYDLKEAKQLLSQVQGLDLSKKFRIPVFNSSYGDPKFGKYISILAKQLNDAGLKVEFIESKDKFTSPSDTETLFKIISLGADVADPLVLFGLMRGKTPLAPHYPPIDPRYDRLYAVAETATSLDTKVLAVKNLSKYVSEKHLTVPLFERRSLFGIDPQRVQEAGKQDGGLAFLISRIRLKR